LPAGGLPGNPHPLHVTPAMVALVNDLHASFALFGVATQPGRAYPPIVVSGELVGGGEVAAMDIELVVESFGLHYLGPRAHQVCMYVCIYI